MARKQEEPEFRLGEVRQDYERSLERYMLKAGLLANAVSTVLSIDERAKALPPAYREALEKHLAEFMAA